MTSVDLVVGTAVVVVATTVAFKVLFVMLSVGSTVMLTVRCFTHLMNGVGLPIVQ